MCPLTSKPCAMTVSILMSIRGKLTKADARQRTPPRGEMPYLRPWWATSCGDVCRWKMEIKIMTSLEGAM